MLVEMTQLVDRDVYTQEGRLLGRVTNVVLDVEGARIDGLYIAEPNALLVEESRSINVPFRWVSAVSDVILLKYFPRRITVKKASAAAKSSETPAAGGHAAQRAA
ncbi:PRC-barrel domain protein [mine drainage metagenome]|uniref:PRC-barrel domain protein n=1 Tax=mine drainage metagenome TaxID=410659 RepID=T1BK86_9ZZZZ